MRLSLCVRSHTFVLWPCKCFSDQSLLVFFILFFPSSSFIGIQGQLPLCCRWVDERIKTGVLVTAAFHHFLNITVLPRKSKNILKLYSPGASVRFAYLFLHNLYIQYEFPLTMMTPWQHGSGVFMGGLLCAAGPRWSWGGAVSRPVPVPAAQSPAQLCPGTFPGTVQVSLLS